MVQRNWASKTQKGPRAGAGARGETKVTNQRTEAMFGVSCALPQCQALQKFRRWQVRVYQPLKHQLCLCPSS